MTEKNGQNSRRHAYLIIAHGNLRVLELLLRMLDDPRNDIWLHMDRKAQDFDPEKTREFCRSAGLHILEKRRDVGWGRSSLVALEMALFREARRSGPYEWYHLLSGSDLPLVSQDRIHSFLAGRSENLIRYRKTPMQGDYERLSLYRHLFGKKNADRILEPYLLKIQRMLSVDRFRKYLRKGFEFCKGAEWVSLTDAAVETLLRNRRLIRRMTRFTHCADECYKQIILTKAGAPVYRNGDGETDHLRFIDWKRRNGWHPYVFRTEDYEKLTGSGCLFARKFDGEADFGIAEAVFRYVAGQREEQKETGKATCTSAF